MRYSSKSLFVTVAVVAVLAAIVGGVMRSIDNTLGSFKDFYAMDQTFLMLCHYIEEHDGDWPRSWIALEYYYDNYRHQGWSESFEEHQELVEIDFTFDPIDYFSQDTSQQPPPKLISLKSYRNDIGWEDLEEVNRRVLSMLQSFHEMEAEK